MTEPTFSEETRLVRIVALDPLLWKRYELMLDAQEVLASLSLLGLAGLWNLSMDRTEATLQKLFDAGLVDVVDDGQYRAL